MPLFTSINTRVAAGIGLLLWVAAVQAADHRIACPLKIEPEALHVVGQPAEWTAFVPGEFYLHSAGPMYGPPSAMTVLKENSVSTHGGKKTMKWVWETKGEPTNSGGKWIACNYGANNDIILSKKIDDGASECTAIYTRNTLGRNDLDIQCKW